MVWCSSDDASDVTTVLVDADGEQGNDGGAQLEWLRERDRSTRDRYRYRRLREYVGPKECYGPERSDSVRGATRR